MYLIRACARSTDRGCGAWQYFGGSDTRTTRTV